MNNQKEKPKFKDYILWALKFYGCSWLAWAISWIPLYIFRGLYKYDETRPFWESVLMSIIGIAIAAVAVYIFALKTDEFEKADPKYVKKLAIGSGIVYTVICTLSFGYYPVCVLVYHLASVLLSLSQGFLGIIIIPLSAAIVNGIFAFAVIKGAKKAKIRREKYRRELLGEKSDVNE